MMDPTVQRALTKISAELEGLYKARDNSQGKQRDMYQSRIDRLTQEETHIRYGGPPPVAPTQTPRQEKPMIAYHELTAIWRAAGGRFHGPNIETGTMPEAALLPFLQALVGPNQSLAQVEARVAALPKYVEPK